MENQKRKRGRPGKDGAKHREIKIRVDDDFRDELKELCEIEGVSMTEYIIRSVRQCGNLTRFKKQKICQILVNTTSMTMKMKILMSSPA